MGTGIAKGEGRERERNRQQQQQREGNTPLIERQGAEQGGAGPSHTKNREKGWGKCVSGGQGGPAGKKSCHSRWENCCQE